MLGRKSSNEKKVKLKAKTDDNSSALEIINLKSYPMKISSKKRTLS